MVAQDKNELIQEAITLINEIKTSIGRSDAQFTILTRDIWNMSSVGVRQLGDFLRLIQQGINASEDAAEDTKENPQ